MVCESGRPLGLGKQPPPPWTTQTEQYWFLTTFVFSAPRVHMVAHEVPLFLKHCDDNCIWEGVQTGTGPVIDNGNTNRDRSSY
jgi:hypothetical protein